MSTAAVVAEATIENNMEQIARSEVVIREATGLRKLAAEMYHQAGILIQHNQESIESLRSMNTALEAGRRSQVAA